MTTATVHQSWDLIESQRRERQNRYLEEENGRLTRQLDELEHGVVESSHLIQEQRRRLEALEGRLKRLGAALFEELGYCSRCAGRRYEQYVETTDAGVATFSCWSERPCPACNAPDSPPDVEEES